MKSAICHSGTLRHEVARTFGEKNTDYGPLRETKAGYSSAALHDHSEGKWLCMSIDQWEATRRTDSLHRRKINRIVLGHWERKER
jgi:hypothetical protein